MYSYTPAGVCSQQIFFDLDGGVVTSALSAAVPATCRASAASSKAWTRLT